MCIIINSCTNIQNCTNLFYKSEYIHAKNFPSAEILCSQLSSPVNGVVTINSQVYSTGVVANYTCHPGYILVGDETRTCEEQYWGTVGTWTGQTPYCQGI